MSNAKIDENGIKTILGTLQSDGVTPIRLKIDPSTKRAKMYDGTTGTASTRTNASRDENGHPVLMGVSSDDMTTPIPIAMDVDGNILIKST